MSTSQSETATLYTVVYEVRGDRQKHDEWWRMIHRLPDGISVKASASFDALAKLDELEGESDMVGKEPQNQTAPATTDELPADLISACVYADQDSCVRGGGWCWCRSQSVASVLSALTASGNVRIIRSEAHV